MRIDLIAVGRLRAGPEADLVARYLERFAKAGRAQGLGPVVVTEIDERKASGPAAQAERLLAAVPERAVAIAFDERGRDLSSPDFAALLRGSAGPVALLIGGADGLDDSVRARADHLVSLGAMVWPHMLVRAMVAEQLYRAASILAGAPYHRGGRGARN